MGYDGIDEEGLAIFGDYITIIVRVELILLFFREFREAVEVLGQHPLPQHVPIQGEVIPGSFYSFRHGVPPYHGSVVILSQGSIKKVYRGPDFFNT